MARLGDSGEVHVRSQRQSRSVDPYQKWWAGPLNSPLNAQEDLTLSHIHYLYHSPSFYRSYLKMACLAAAPGTETATSRSNRPGRRNAGSSALGRLVAARKQIVVERGINQGQMNNASLETSSNQVCHPHTCDDNQVTS